tara:strand:+ start:2324 stop:2641 length:318 start_codon:yes stop_codon:yes gene_type:complete
MSNFFISKYNKLIIAIILLILASSLVHAKNSMSDKNEPPPRPCFNSLDLNEDGDIDFDEFSSQEIPHGDHQTIFNSIDINNNGVISSEEFINHKPPQPQKRKDNQ